MGHRLRPERVSCALEIHSHSTLPAYTTHCTLCTVHSAHCTLHSVQARVHHCVYLNVFKTKSNLKPNPKLSPSERFGGVLNFCGRFAKKSKLQTCPTFVWIPFPKYPASVTELSQDKKDHQPKQLYNVLVCLMARHLCLNKLIFRKVEASKWELC